MGCISLSLCAGCRVDFQEDLVGNLLQSNDEGSNAVQKFAAVGQAQLLRLSSEVCQQGAPSHPVRMESDSRTVNEESAPKE